MILSERIKDTKASVTLKVNEKINRMVQDGKHIYNMTSGQLPFKPCSDFISSITKQTNFLKSYQYSPISGIPELRDKFFEYTSERREINLKECDVSMDCIISNGAKHSLYNVFGALINPGDEVIILTPYYVSYPEIIKFWGGIPTIVKAQAFNSYTPAIDEIESAITKKTKAIIINSPNNPAGIHYSDNWMKEFGSILKKYPDVMAVSDELYSELNYFDPKPTFFYQYDKSLLPQTIIVDSISKSFAATGLRIGYCIADASLTKAMAKIQSQTTSGPNSLIQRALIEFDFNELENLFDPVKAQLRECAQTVRLAFRDAKLSNSYYQTNSAFYYLLDFSRMPFFKNLENSEQEDRSKEIVEDILERTGIALVPGSAFGYPNSARMSMTLEIAPFKEAIDKLTDYISDKDSKTG